MENKTEDPFSFVAFGGGQRNCIGQYLAKIEYKITLAKFLTKYEFNTK
jgi:cytochrome P450